MFPNPITLEKMNDCTFNDLIEPCCQKFLQWNVRMFEVHSEHAEWVGFVYALITYLNEREAASQILEVGSDVQRHVYELIAGLLRRGISLELPDVEGEEMRNLRSLCERAWDGYYTHQG